jgi:hypothetical protein
LKQKGAQNEVLKSANGVLSAPIVQHPVHVDAANRFIQPVFNHFGVFINALIQKVQKLLKKR